MTQLSSHKITFLIMEYQYKSLLDDTQIVPEIYQDILKNNGDRSIRQEILDENLD